MVDEAGRRSLSANEELVKLTVAQKVARAQMDLKKWRRRRQPGPDTVSKLCSHAQASGPTGQAATKADTPPASDNTSSERKGEVTEMVVVGDKETRGQPRLLYVR